MIDKKIKNSYNKKKESIRYIIISAGPAGMTVYIKQSKWQLKVVAGGQMNNPLTSKVQDTLISVDKLLRKMFEPLENLGI